MEKITYLPLNEYLVESPFNPRKSYPEDELQELAESIKSQGVMQPIVVRHLTHDFGGGVSDMEYQIVFGHRRFRAAKLAKLELIPAIVREMDDQQAAIAQTHENSKRRDISAMEEADSFERLHVEHGLSADQIVEAVGKSRSYVYGRLKLAKAAPELRKATTEDGLGGETALLIARIPEHNLQREALEACKAFEYTANGRAPAGWIPTRAAKRVVSELFKLTLHKAPFDVQDPTLNTDRGTCSGCPKRAGNDPTFDDTLDSMTCLDKSCYQVKVAAHVAKATAKAKKAGLLVLDGDDAKAVMPDQWSGPQGYTKLSAIAYNDDTANGEDSSEVSFEAALKNLGKKAPKATVIVNPHVPGELLHCITNDQASQLLEALGVEDDETKADRRRDRWEQEQAQREEAELAALTPEERALRVNKNAILEQAFSRASAAKRRSTGELLLICRALNSDSDELDDRLVELMGWTEELKAEHDAGEQSRYEDDEHFAWARLRDCSPNDLAKFAVLSALLCMPVRYDANEAREDLRATAALYGIDPFDPASVVQAPAQDASTPPHAARAPKSSTAGGGAKYRNAATGETWGGRGLQPAWLKAAIAAGKKLEDFVLEIPPPAARAPKKAKSKVAVGGAPGAPDAAGLVEGVKNEAGSAGERDPNTADMFDDQKDDAGFAGGTAADAGAQEARQ